jgi:hypothetical protein
MRIEEDDQREGGDRHGGGRGVAEKGSLALLARHLKAERGLSVPPG